MNGRTPVSPACIALGSNLGDRAAHLEAAFKALAEIAGTRVTARSEIFETAPVGGPAQGPFLNAAVRIETTLPPRALLDALHAIEQSRGRARSEQTRWGPRTLDLDLLLYDDRVIDEPGLTVPHPSLHERLFVLDPLCQIAPDWLVPTLGRSVRALRDDLRAGSITP